MNDRIKKVRVAQTPKLSQEAFGAKIGITGAAISRIESGERNPTEQVILGICREFRVNEQWLRTGEGEMFRTPSRRAEINEFFGKMIAEPTDFRHRLISVLARLNEDEWALVEKMANALCEEMKKGADQ